MKDVEACVLKLKESLVDKNTSQLVTATQASAVATTFAYMQ